mmetsp:Transcript_11485/g.17403  ORF Transcript_11485/g.17403 Transcript_11485/m.17403 type:complete len:239 (+) Transcript_11485:68-784(+)
MDHSLVKLVIIACMLLCICVLLPVLVWFIKSERAVNIQEIAKEVPKHTAHQELSECVVSPPLPSPLPSPLPEEFNSRRDSLERDNDKHDENIEPEQQDEKEEQFQMSLGPSLASVVLKPAPIDIGGSADNDDATFKMKAPSTNQSKQDDDDISTLSSVYLAPENYPKNTSDTPYLDEGVNETGDHDDDDGVPEGVELEVAANDTSEDDLYENVTNPMTTTMGPADEHGDTSPTMSVPL